MGRELIPTEFQRGGNHSFSNSCPKWNQGWPVRVDSPFMIVIKQECFNLNSCMGWRVGSNDLMPPSLPLFTLASFRYWGWGNLPLVFPKSWWKQTAKKPVEPPQPVSGKNPLGSCAHLCRFLCPLPNLEVWSRTSSLLASCPLLKRTVFKGLLYYFSLQ